MKPTMLTLTLAIAALPACNHTKQDMQTLCDGPNIDAAKAAIAKTNDPALANIVIANEVEKRISDKGAVAILHVMILPGRPLPSQGQALRKMAADNGVTSCAWAEWMEKQPATAGAKP